MELECDVLLPAALESVIHKYNAPNLKCKVIAEAANAPTTVWGEEICQEKGILTIPDVLLNAGSVTVSYFEWLKNLQHVEQGRLTKRWEEKSKKEMYETVTGARLTKLHFDQMRDQHKLHGAGEIDIVYSALEEIISGSIEENWQKALTLNTNMRLASLSTGIEKIGNHFKQSGILF